MVKQMTPRRSGILTAVMLRPRIARVDLLAVPVAVLLTTLMVCAQAQQPAANQKAKVDSTAPQTYEESTRFLKSLPPKPATQLPYPSIATPPIEDQAPIPLLTEAQQKQMEEDLTRLGKSHGQPRAAKQGTKTKQDASTRTDKSADRKAPKPKQASKPLPITNN